MFLKKIILLLLLLFATSGCATYTIGNSVKITHLQERIVTTGEQQGIIKIGGDGFEWGKTIVRDDDGGYKVFGYTHKSFGESTDFFVSAYTSDDNLKWAKTYGGTHKEMPIKAIHVKDNGCVIMGTSQSMFFTAMKVFAPSYDPRPIVIKIDSDGAIDWAFAIDSQHSLSDIIALNDGGFLLTGTQLDENSYPYFIKLSSEGKKLWSYRYDSGLTYCAGQSVIESMDQSILIAGYTGQLGQPIVIKVNKEGDPLWAKKYSVAGSHFPDFMIQGNPGEFIISGLSKINASDNKGFFVANIFDNGQIGWFQIFSNKKNNRLRSIMKGFHDDYLLLGDTDKGINNLVDGVVLLIDNEGKLRSSSYIKGDQSNEIESAIKDKDDMYILLGSTDSYKATFADILLFRWKPDLSAQSDYAQESIDCKIGDVKITKTQLAVKLTDITHYIAVKKIK